MCVVEDGSILLFLIESYLYEELDMLGTITSVILTFHHVNFTTLILFVTWLPKALHYCITLLE